MKVRLGGAMPMESLEVVDISLKGLGLRLPYPVATGQELLAVIYHPILEGPLSLQSKAAWCRMAPGDPHPHAGLEFMATNDDDRMNLRRIQAAEVSCRVLDGDRMAGFVMNQAEGRWALYDENTVKVATLRKDGIQFQVTFLGATPSESIHTLDADTLPDALAMALELDNPPFVVPPEGGHWVPVRPRPGPARPANVPVRPAVPRAPKVPQRADKVKPPAPEPKVAEPKAAEGGDTATVNVPAQAGGPSAYHSVLAGGFHVGFVAVTSVDDVWSIYDGEWNEVAIMSPHESKFKLVHMGSDPNESLDFMMAKSFLGGLQIAFDLNVQPVIDPPLPEPEDAAGDEAEESSALEDSSEEVLGADQPHHCIMDSEQGLVGYVARVPGRSNDWSVYSTLREKVATVGQEGERYKLLFVGQNPEDSLEYMVAKSFRGALALTFDLEALPALDPPLN